QENRGLAATLNVGIKLARGKYIARMDADDIAFSNRFERQLGYLQEHPNVVLLGSAVEMIDSKGAYLCVDPPFVGSKFLKKYLFRVGNPFKHPTVIFNRQAAIDCGGFNELIGKYFEDYFLWSRLAEKGDIANLDEVLLKYRITPGSIMGSIKTKEFSDFMLGIIARGDFDENDLKKMIDIKKTEALSGSEHKQNITSYNKRIEIIKSKKSNKLFQLLSGVVGKRLSVKIMIWINQNRFSWVIK